MREKPTVSPIFEGYRAFVFARLPDGTLEQWCGVTATIDDIAQRDRFDADSRVTLGHMKACREHWQGVHGVQVRVLLLSADEVRFAPQASLGERYEQGERRTC